MLAYFSTGSVFPHGGNLMPLQTLARDEVVHASPDTSVTELAKQMRDETVGSVVITNGNSPVGIVTDRDLTTRVVAENGSGDALTAEDVMTSDITWADADIGLYEAGELMSEHGIRRLPICNDSDELCGIISADDIIELLADEQRHLASVVQAQRPPY